MRIAVIILLFSFGLNAQTFDAECPEYPTGKECCIPNGDIRPVWLEFTDQQPTVNTSLGGTTDGLISLAVTECDGLLLGGSDATSTFVSNDPNLPVGSFWGAGGLPNGPPHTQGGCFSLCMNAETKVRDFIVKYGNLNIAGETATFQDNYDAIITSGNYTITNNGDGTVTYTSLGNSTTNQDDNIYLHWYDRQSVCHEGRYDWSCGGCGGITMWTAAVYDDRVQEFRDECGKTTYKKCLEDGTFEDVEVTEIDCSKLPPPAQVPQTFNDCDSVLVYTWDFVEGIREQIWSEEDAVEHDDVRNIFSGNPDLVSFGTPSHPNAPTIDITVANWNNNTVNDPSNGVDQFRWIGYFYAPQDGTVLSDDNNNNGERFRLWLGDCCSAPKVIFESPEGENSPFAGGTGNAVGVFATVNEGWHLLIVEGSDLGAFGGFNLQLDGVNYSGPYAQTKPQLVCRNEPCEYEFADDEMNCDPGNCQPSAIIPSEGGGGGNAECCEMNADAIEDLQEQLDDCEDCDIQNELQELSWDADRKELTISGRNTVELEMPTWTTLAAPTVAGVGSYTTDISQVLETDTYWRVQQDGDCRECYEFQYRVRGTLAAGTGWGYVNIPNIGGWDRRVFDVGNYVQVGNINNPDTPNNGAEPDAPHMSPVSSEWSNTGRLYVSQLNDRDNDATVWTEFIVQYCRN